MEEARRQKKKAEVEVSERLKKWISVEEENAEMEVNASLLLAGAKTRLRVLQQ